MRKQLLTLSSCLMLGLATFAQTENTGMLLGKKGTPILPQEGDYGIGISANPFLEYTGNMFNNGGGNAAPSWTYGANPFSNNSIGNTVSVLGKYMISDNQAYRVRFNIAHQGRRNTQQIVKDTLTPDLNNLTFVNDVQRTKYTYVTLAAGKEWRRGKGRLQGVFGAEGILEFAGARNSYDYGNVLDQNFTAPNTFGAFGDIVGGSNIINPSSRVLNNKSGLFYGIGARGFAGVEFFVGPKISLGAEFGYTIRYTHKAKSTTTYETFNTIDLKRVEKTIRGNSGFSSFNLGVENLNGVINIHFYF
jgi:hypothetical protein